MAALQLSRVMALVAALVLSLFLLASVQASASASAQLELSPEEWLQEMGLEGPDVFMADDGVAESVEGSLMAENEKEGEEAENHIRRILRRWSRYYISYGALSANRIPCRARSGRSYYTRNCYGASGPVRPYRRGCSAITRCARSTG